MDGDTIYRNPCHPWMAGISTDGMHHKPLISALGTCVRLDSCQRSWYCMQQGDVHLHDSAQELPIDGTLLSSRGGAL